MRLIDADELKDGLFHLEGETSITDRQLGYQAGWNDALMYAIDDAPTVDAEPVVRCKDCYYCVTEKSFDKEYLYCDAFYEHAEGDLIGVSLMVEPNHFCSWGERREDETD